MFGSVLETLHHIGSVLFNFFLKIYKSTEGSFRGWFIVPKMLFPDPRNLPPYRVRGFSPVRVIPKFFKGV